MRTTARARTPSARLPARLLALLLPLLAACGPVPQPFHSDGGLNPLLEDRRILSSVKVEPVAGLPALAPAVADALGWHDVVASAGDAGPEANVLTGLREPGALRWRMVTAKGKVLGEVRVPMPAPPADKLALATLANASAKAVAPLLGGRDTGLTDLEAEPHVAVGRIEAPPGVDGPLLTTAMAEALGAQGMAVGAEHPVATVEGRLRIQSLGEKDLVQIEWVVRDAAGKVAGTISQGNPVEHARVLGSMGALSREIAAAAAPGVAGVIRRVAAARQAPPDAKAPRAKEKAPAPSGTPKGAAGG